MQVVHEVCCGLDVHKKSVTACVVWAAGRRRQTRAFGTFTRDLLELGDWLRSCGATHVALESTGVYWKPVRNLLEGQFEVLLVNAQHIKAVPGRKTDQKDSEWIADLLQHGLLRPSGSQSPGYRLLHFARPDLLPRFGSRLLRSPEPRRPAQALNQASRRLGLQSDRRALSPSRLEAIF